MKDWLSPILGTSVLLILTVFLFVYIGFNATVQRQCGPGVIGQRGEQGKKGRNGIVLFPGPTGERSTLTGETGDIGPTATMLIPGPRGPNGGGTETGGTGAQGYNGAQGPLLNPFIPITSINFGIYNGGIGTDLQDYFDTGYFQVTVICNAADPIAGTTNIRFIKLGSMVVCQIQQFSLNHGIEGYGSPDNIRFILPTFIMTAANETIYLSVFFPQLPTTSTTPWLYRQPITVYDGKIDFVECGSVYIKLTPPNDNMLTMWIACRAQYTDQKLATPFPYQLILHEQFPAGTGLGLPLPLGPTFGLIGDVAVLWNTLT